MELTTFKVFLVALALIQVIWAQTSDDLNDNDLDRVIAEYEIRFQDLIKGIHNVAIAQDNYFDQVVFELIRSYETAQVAIYASIGALQSLVDAEEHVAEEENRDIRECIVYFERFLDDLKPKSVDVCRNLDEEDKLRDTLEDLSVIDAIVLMKNECLLEKDDVEQLTSCFEEAIGEGRAAAVTHAIQIDTEILRITNQSDECVDNITQHVTEELERQESQFTECASRGQSNDGYNEVNRSYH